MVSQGAVVANLVPCLAEGAVAGRARREPRKAPGNAAPGQELGRSWAPGGAGRREGHVSASDFPTARPHFYFSIL